MTNLAPTVGNWHDPADFKRLFNEDEGQALGLFDRREVPPIGQPNRSCDVNLFFGVFMDGTRNSYGRSSRDQDLTHSNVARLFDTFPGQIIAPASLPRGEANFPQESGRYPNYFRIYAPGVGTEFNEIGDDGRGVRGPAAGHKGDRRIVWTLMQMLNALHMFFLKGAVLFTAGEVMSKVEEIELNARALAVLPQRMPRVVDVRDRAKFVLRDCLERLHRAIRPHIPDARTGQCQAVDPGIAREIFVSTFGFSRGATAARAFANWLVALCELDAHLLGRSGLTLGGIPVTFEFLGLFDTVASVGLAASTHAGHGHDKWADAERSLRVPVQVRRTLHLVAAHELRRSFPLDSISLDGVMPAGAEEIVFPGVHSDVGGGYAPKEQGRGTRADGSDMLSRIPLVVMYRAARLAGVPLKLERASPVAKERFRIHPTVIDAFNDYIEASPLKSGSLRDLLRSQMQLAILWRKPWAGRVAQMPSVARAAQGDINDIVSADREFVEEMRLFEAYRTRPTIEQRVCMDVCGSYELANVKGVDRTREEEWAAIAKFWAQPKPETRIAVLLGYFVHDSHAGFKPLGMERAEIEQQFKIWARLYKKSMSAAYPDRPLREEPNAEVRERLSKGIGIERVLPITAAEAAWLRAYLLTDTLPPMPASGREFFGLGAGYLRFRRIYAGSDRFISKLGAPFGESTTAMA